MARSSTPADTLPSPLAPYGTIAFPSPLPLEQALEDRADGDPYAADLLGARGARRGG